MADDVLTDVDVEGSDIVCSVCYSGTSDVPNEIVICDQCDSGYHQRCHDPKIPASFLLSDLEWICRRCTVSKSLAATSSIKKTPAIDDAPTTMNSIHLTFPYELNSLTWDSQHKNNLEQKYCYCGGPSTGLTMIQCCKCRQLFHQACLFKQPLLYGDRFFVFTCAICNHGTQSIKRMDLKWSDVVHLVLFNLSQKNNKTYYDVDDTIMPFIEKNWEWMRVTGEAAQTSSKERKAAVLSTLQGDRTKFKCGCETKKKASLWGLRTRNPPPVTKIPVAPKQAQKMTSSFSPLPNMPQRKSSPKQKKAASSSCVQQSSNGTCSALMPSSKDKNSVNTSAKNLKKNLKHVLEAQKTSGKLKKCASNGFDAPGEQTSKDSRPANKFAPVRNGVVMSKESTPFSTISLNTMIPPPENFDGPNNPFRNANRRPTIARFLVRKKSREDSRAFGLADDARKKPCGRLPAIVREHFAVTKSKNELLFERLDGGLKENDRLTDQSLFSVQDAKFFIDNGENFKILAKRVTLHGDVQYLVEWEGIGSATSVGSSGIK